MEGASLNGNANRIQALHSRTIYHQNDAGESVKKHGEQITVDCNAHKSILQSHKAGNMIYLKDGGAPQVLQDQLEGILAVKIVMRLTQAVRVLTQHTRIQFR